MAVCQTQPQGAGDDHGWAVEVKAPRWWQCEYLASGGRLTIWPAQAQVGTMEDAERAAASIVRRNRGRVRARPVRLRGR